MIALGEKGVLPRGAIKNKRLSKADILAALAQIDASLPLLLDAFLHKCQAAGFRAVTNKSLMIKAAIPDFGEVNFGTIFPTGKLQTNYISDSSERIGDMRIASEYLDSVAALLEGATVRRDGKSWTWRVEVFGELPAIAQILTRGDDWLALMRTARHRFAELAAGEMLMQST